MITILATLCNVIVLKFISLIIGLHQYTIRIEWHDNVEFLHRDTKAVCYVCDELSSEMRRLSRKFDQGFLPTRFHVPFGEALQATRLVSVVSSSHGPGHPKHDIY
jgi:hypothetical protein